MKMLIPTESIRWRATDAERQAQKEFESYFQGAMDTQFPEWREHFNWGWTHSFFSIGLGNGKEDCHIRLNDFVTKWKRGTEFNIDKKRSEIIANTIKNRIRAKQQRIESQNLQNRLKHLMFKVVEKYQSTSVSIKLDEMACKIEVGKQGEYWFNADGEIYLKRNGDISKPQQNTYTRIRTLLEAEQFIEEFQPIHNQLLDLANKIKSELPKEWFEDK